ncbi:hypothetical protein [Oryzomonas rubra]|uniref:Uncharacterized protein n=1 Tax=Oryzomonas rubra TaxID=2509454 RepID=A0A5A9XMZ5_9BACT|nr:hypothetical protein [Oryzomonas rubra]KAA0894220.1 hypothetical protein ET418_04495 [Oryzomonas rubra]
MEVFMKRILAGLAVCAMTVLYGCGGGGTAAQSTVSGTASQGAALASGTTVTLTDAKGATKTAKVGANGAFSVVVDGLTAPFLLNAGTYYSFAAAPGTTNINPLTNLSMQLAEGTATVTTTLPTNFTTQFAAVVVSLKAALSGLYPASVTASTDFLNGNISIGSGVDKVFDNATITAPDTNGNYAISISGQTVVSGTTSSGTVTATPNATAISTATASVFPIAFTSSMFSGKTTTNPTTWNGSVALNTKVWHADGTWTQMTSLNGSAVGTGSGTWSINSSGQLIFTTTAATYTTTLNSPTTVTLVSYTSTGLTVFGDGVQMVFTYASGSAPVFTSAMLSGKTFSAHGVRADGSTFSATVTYNADGTITGMTDGHWSINQAGNLVFSYTPTGGGTETDTLAIVSTSGIQGTAGYAIYCSGSYIELGGLYPGETGNYTVTVALQ